MAEWRYPTATYKENTIGDIVPSRHSDKLKSGRLLIICKLCFLINLALNEIKDAKLKLREYIFYEEET